MSNVASESAVRTRGCITPSSDRDPPGADSITIAGDDVRLCFGAQPDRSCWRIDVATKQRTPLPVTSPRAEPRPAAAVVRDDGTASLCGPGGSPCTSVPIPGPIQQPAWLAVSADLSTLAIPDDHATLRIYDVARATLRATIHGWPDSPMAGDDFTSPPTFATPDRMIVWSSWTPVSEQGRIFDLAGHQLAVVGHDFTSIDPDEHTWHVHGTEWAIEGETNTLLTVDVAHPTVTATYDLSALLALPRPPADRDTHSLDVLAVAGSAKRLIIVTGENPVTIGVLDRATNQLDELELPRCPPHR